MIQQFFTDLGPSSWPWFWLILGLVLLVLEIAAPGTMFLWFGVAAVVVGGISFVIDFGWQFAFILFGVLSLVSVIVGRMLLKRSGGSVSDQPLLNQRALALVGRSFHLDEPIENGQGRVKVNDSYWRVRGLDCPAGSKVVVTGSDGTILDVEPSQ
ncbi:NfeD family protein [Cohaesibacter celericrescens]|uniref:NfeD-like C-terminal domain-containing protein n=1 Tax=Cohaesibacter celericrescens TaxID=2067669 RepID=A0A2N5XL91_9HYPH|nr:NfeD family protein [Cohaesibacter celericrescens]PLW75262.1 hypothetical protein C0081_20830 [Cohaesibacter celericrescens]